MKNRIIFILLILICLPSYAQINQYVIITFESKRSIDEEVQRYYWMAPVDSIKDNEFHLYPLYLVLGEYSYSDFSICLKGDTVDILSHVISTGDFDDEYEAKVDKLISLIDNNRIKIQTIDIGWEANKNAKNKVTVFATPISGNFCNCFQNHILINKFQSFVYLPVSDFVYNEFFWQSPSASIVKFSNYSYIAYKSHLLLEKGVQNGAK